MPSCAVPKRPNSKRKKTAKYSCFKVPADKNLRCKWVEAIPGVSNLRSTQTICVTYIFLKISSCVKGFHMTRIDQLLQRSPTYVLD